MATDFLNGQFPRPGRVAYGGFNWLLRVFDKARAAKYGTIHDYIYPCPIDKAVFQRWGIVPDDFTAALDACETDDQILAWVRGRVSDEGREAANQFILVDKAESLTKQDAEEGVVAA